MYNVLVWLAIELLLLWALSRVTASYRDRQWFKALFFPGALLEGFLRMVACCLAATQVREVRFFEDGKPFAVEGESRVPYVGPVVGVTLWLVFHYALFRAWVLHSGGVRPYELALPHVDPVAISAGYFKIDARAYFYGLETFFAGTDWSSWEVWALLYVFVGSFPFFALDSRKLRHGFVVIALLGAVAFVANYLGMRPGFLSRGWYLTAWVLPDHFRVYSLFMTLLVATLALHLAVQLACRATVLVAACAAERRRDRKDARKGAGKPAKRKEHAAAH